MLPEPSAVLLVAGIGHGEVWFLAGVPQICPHKSQRTTAHARSSDPTKHAMSAEEETKPVRHLAPAVLSTARAFDR